MKVCLSGPDDLGGWHLQDEDGNSWQVVESNVDHIAAAELFGWIRPEKIDNEDDLIEEAHEFLMDHIGDEITAPRHIAEYFEEIGNDDL